MSSHAIFRTLSAPGPSISRAPRPRQSLESLESCRLGAKTPIPVSPSKKASIRRGYRFLRPHRVARGILCSVLVSGISSSARHMTPPQPTGSLSLSNAAKCRTASGVGLFHISRIGVFVPAGIPSSTASRPPARQTRTGSRANTNTDKYNPTRILNSPKPNTEGAAQSRLPCCGCTSRWCRILARFTGGAPVLHRP